ncbi:ABC transporter permease [Paenibacillus thiaminolyticus]|uniref:ABC transporter permease n=1 Tax=Paenibacillus thiaminolyticus TaxID=49283 RepID=A0A3A3GEJ5_PANTH|nr:ABC transporter permease [Paenibacillus thiaminolyticus]RJG17691.1 ABC transporter permease [Paenibacillus thiaminolyticus]
MNIWNIALKEIKSNLRNTRTFVFMLALPIVLMLILGAALTNTFTDGVEIDSLRLLVRNEWTDSQGKAAWSQFVQVIKQEGVEVVQAPAGMNGQEEVRTNRFTAYAELDAEGIKFYGSSKNTIESNIIQGMLTAFADRYSLMAAAVHTDPAAARMIADGARESGDFIRDTSLNPDKRPDSFGYYAIAMTTMIALYSVFSAGYLFRGERIRNTAIRLMAAPIGKGEIFIGKVIGSTFINLLCVLLVVLFSQFAFHADWGTHYGMIFLVLLTEVLLAVRMGVAVSFLLQGESSQGIIMMFTQVASFIGGAYFPIGETEGIMTWITNLSPLRWANTALTEIIYAGNAAAGWPAIGLNTGIAALFLFIVVISMRRREAL